MESTSDTDLQPNTAGTMVDLSHHPPSSHVPQGQRTKTAPHRTSHDPNIEETTSPQHTHVCTTSEGFENPEGLCSDILPGLTDPEALRANAGVDFTEHEALQSNAGIDYTEQKALQTNTTLDTYAHEALQSDTILDHEEEMFRKISRTSLSSENIASAVDYRRESVMLTDGTNLHSETDVDRISTGDTSIGAGEISIDAGELTISSEETNMGAGCLSKNSGETSIEVVNKFHNISDPHSSSPLHSVSPSISTDKTVTSSPLSSSSVGGDSLRSFEPSDSSPRVSMTRHTQQATASTSSCVKQETYTTRTVVDDSEKTKPETCTDRTSVKASVTDTSVSELPDQTRSENETELKQTRTVQNESGGSELNNHSAMDCEPHENNCATSSSEPFSCFVDMSRLDNSIVSQQGNVQEQRLLSLVESVGDPHCRKQLKKLLRSGVWEVGCTVRRTAWIQVCSHLHKLEKPFIYLQMEKELFGDMEDEDIPVPTWRQQPTQEEQIHAEYYLTPKGKNTAHKIVAVIGQLSPDISYCPGLLSMVDLLLHYMETTDAFSCVLTLLQSKGPIYLMQSRVAFEASKRVMKDLAKKYIKSAYVSLVRSCSHVETVFDNWMIWIYADLPFNYVVVITDSYMMEGIKVLYRVALAILSLFTKHAAQELRSTTTATNIAHSISNFCHNPPVTPAKLLKVAFRIRGFSRRKLQKLQSLHEGLITSGAVSLKTDMPRVGSSHSLGEQSMAVSTAVSMAHPSTKMMGFHSIDTNVLSVDQLVTIWSWLPSRYAIYQPDMLFNSANLGTSLMTLYAHIEQNPCTIIVIKTVEGEVFGAFCADPWIERRTHCRPVRFFGTGETFLFQLVPQRIKYEWVGKPDPHVPLSANMFQAGDNNSLMIGGGSGCGIQLDGMMERCRTETCDTFNNPPLCPSQDFVPAAVEVFGLM